jgi:hypothetical protein
MKTTMKFLSLVIILVTFTFTSCSKEGESGPMGQAGANGTNGLDGIDGQDGEDGNANVMASDWFEPTESSFSVNNPRYKALPLATNLSSSILEDGVILVYYDNDTDIYLLPNHVFAPDGTNLKSVDSKINRASRALYINIRRSDSDLAPGEYLWDPSGPAYGKGVRFRYVIIPSNATSAKKAIIDFKKMTYYEVMDHFGLDY